jgi:hypothetical protein
MPITGHNRPLPDGLQIAEALQAMWRQQAQRFTGDPDNIRFSEQEEAQIQRLFVALLGPLWRQAWLEALYRIRLAAMNQGRESPMQVRMYGGMVEISAGPITKDLTSFAVGFDVYNEDITNFIESQVYHFLTSVNDTTAELLRVTMFLAESEGWNPLDRTVAIQDIFVDPKRAFLISNTESSRAVHGGQYEAARKTGLVDRKKWLASSDACKEICLPLNGNVVDLDQPFLVKGKGPYATILYPPAHPACMCTYVDLLAVGQPED